MRFRVIENWIKRMPRLWAFSCAVNRAGPILNVQAAYGELFDRGRATSLLLFERILGESDRGRTMVDLMAQYEQHGLQLGDANFPIICTAVSGIPCAVAEKRSVRGLQDIAPILALLQHFTFATA